MSAWEMMAKNAVDLLIAKLPPEVIEQVAVIANSAIELKCQLDSLQTQIAGLEQGQGELKLLLASLVEVLQQRKDATNNERPAIGANGAKPPAFT